MDSDGADLLPVPSGCSGRAGTVFLAGLSAVLDRMFEPCCLLLICMILSVGSIFSAVAYARKAEDVLLRVAETRDDLERKMEATRELCRQTRASLEEEMRKYDVSDELVGIDRRLDGIEAYNRETRKYVEWER